MAWSFRKRIKIAPGVHMNIGGNGPSLSVGGKGISVTSGKNGTYLNSNIPGTGLRNRQKLDSIYTRNESDNYDDNNSSQGMGCFSIFGIIIVIILLIITAVVLFSRSITLGFGFLILLMIGFLLAPILKETFTNNDEQQYSDYDNTIESEELSAYEKEIREQTKKWRSLISKYGISYNNTEQHLYSEKVKDLVDNCPEKIEVDSLFENAARIIVEKHNGASSLVVRELAIGYKRCGRIMSQLELFGIIGAWNAEHNGRREVYVQTNEELDSIIAEIKKIPLYEANKNTSQIKKDYDSFQEYNTLSFKKLDSLIGLDSVKDEVKKLANFIVIKQKRQTQGLKTTPISYHCVFTGNPGTGKTTVARIVADIYKKLGILSKGHLVETDRAGLVAEYVGQTAVKTNKIIDKALDGVLFIDEAYSLASGGDNDFGREAISTLLKRMEDDRDRIVIILAGYTEDMKRFIDTNPGLQSRFNRYIDFPDYSEEELFKIFEKNCKQYDYKITPEAKTKLKEYISSTVKQKDKNFGNARFVRNLFEKTIERQANRLSNEKDLTDKELTEIRLTDIP